MSLPAGGNLFFAGDTGFGDGRWASAAAQDGPYRLALIPIGAYLPRAMMQSNHVAPGEAVRLFRMLGAADALAIHWGTFQLSYEAIDDPPRQLAASRAQARLDPARFRALQPGETWDVPPRH